MPYLLLIFITLYIFFSWRRIDWALMLLLFALPSYQIRFNILGIPTTLLEIIIFIIFTIWLIKNYKQIINNLKLKIKKLFKNSKIQKFKNSKRYPFDIEIILILIIAFISIAIAGFSNASFGIFKAYFFEPIIIFILAINIFKNNIYKIIWPLTLSALLISIYAIAQKFGLLFSPTNFLPRITGPFPYPNALGLYLAPLVPLIIGYLGSLLSKNTNSTPLNRIDKPHPSFVISTEAKRSGKIHNTPNTKKNIPNKTILKRYPEYTYQLLLIFLAIPASLLAIFFARSEGALIGLLISLIIMPLFWIANTQTKTWFKKIPIILTALIFIFTITSSFIYLKIIPEYKYFNSSSNILNYITDKSMLKDFSGEVRKQQWRETWNMLSSQPKNFIFGAGLSNYQNTVAPFHQEGIFFNKNRDKDFRRKIVLFDKNYKDKYWHPVEVYMYPHNLILNFWTELGLAGMLLFIWIIIKFFYEGIKIFQNSDSTSKYLSLGLIGAMTVIIIHGIVDVPYFKNDLAILFWILIAMLGMIKINQNKQT